MPDPVLSGNRQAWGSDRRGAGSQHGSLRGQVSTCSDSLRRIEHLPFPRHGANPWEEKPGGRCSSFPHLKSGAARPGGARGGGEMRACLPSVAGSLHGGAGGQKPLWTDHAVSLLM